MRTSLLMPARRGGSCSREPLLSAARGALALAAALLLPRGAGATPEYFAYSSDLGRTTWNASYWSFTTGGPYVSAWTGYNDAVFEGVGGPVAITATVQANSLTFNVNGYSIVGTSTLQLGNPTYPGLFVASGVIATNGATFSNSGTGNAYHIGSATNQAALFNGTNVLNGNFAALTANNRQLAIDAGNLWLATTNTSLSGGTGGIIIATNATLTYDVASGGTVAWGTTAATIVRGPGTFRKLGPGTLVFGSGGQNIQVGFNAGALIDVQGGLLTGSSSAHGFWTTNLASMNIASGASVNFVEAGFASAATTIQLDALTGAGSLIAGYQAYTKTLTLGVANGSGTFTGPITEGNSSQVAITKTGTGTQTLGGNNYYRYGLTVNNGTLNLTGSNFLSNGAITVGPGTLTVGGPLNNGYTAVIRANPGGVINFTNNGAWTNSNASGTYFYVGNGAGTGVVNQTAGTISYGAAAGSYLLMGNGGSTSNNWGIYNLKGGTLVSVGQIIMGVNPFVGSIFNVSGGNLFAPNGLAIGRQDAVTAFTTNYFNQSGGAVNVSALYLAKQPTNLCYLNITNGSFIAASFPNLATSAADVAHINLGTGAVATLAAFPTASTALGAASTADITFDGGTLIPYASSATYMQGLTAAYLAANGGTINVPSGLSISVAQPLLDATPQIGQLIVPGAGTLALNGANTYSGTTTVSNGNLVVNGSLANGTVAVGSLGTLTVSAAGTVGGSLALGYGGAAYVNGTVSGGATVGGGATLGGIGTVNGAVTVNGSSSTTGILSPGVGVGAYGTLTLGNNLVFTSGASLAIDINTDPVLTTSDLVQVNGNVSTAVPVPVSFNFPSGPPALGVAYTIITNFSGAIDPNFSTYLVGGTHLYTASFAQTANTVTVTFGTSSGLNQLTWRGDGAANVWEVGIVQNWVNSLSSAPSWFFTGDNVTFDDTSSNQGVNLFGPAAPASVTVSATKNYVFGGTGRITGAGGLAQTGSGSLTVATANDYAGNTLIANGALVFTNGGSVAGFITNDALLAFNRTDSSTVTNPISGTGWVAKGGAGSVVLATSNSYAGLTLITNGVLYPHDPSALGLGAAPTIITNAGQLYLDTAVNLASNPLILSGAGFGGNGTLRKGGASVSTLGGPVTLASSSTVYVDGGATLNLSNATAGVSGNNVTLTLTGSGTEKIYGPVSLGSGYVDKEGSGTAILAGTNNAWAATTVIGGGTLQIGDGPLNADGSFGPGAITDNGALVFDSATSFTLSANLTGSGSLSHIGSGALTLANTTSIGGATVGASAGVTSVLNLTGPSYTSSSTFVLGNTGNNATGIVNQATGAVVIGAGGNQLLLGNSAPGVTTCGIYNLWGGSLTAVGPTYGLLLGANSFDIGIFNMTNGTFAVSTIEIGRSEASTIATNTTGIFSMSGGTATATTLAIGGGNLFNEASTTGMLAVANSTFVATNFTYLAAGSNSVVSMNFGPNSLISLPAFPATRGAGATETLILDGTTLTPPASSGNYISALTTAEITPNGVTFNVTNNLSVTVPQAFVYDAPFDPCFLTKQGTGTLVLSGANTYGYYGGLNSFPQAGGFSTYVNQGSLLVNTASGQIAGPVYVATGATFGGNGQVANGSVGGFFDGEGSVDVATNAVLSPGSAPGLAGTLTVAGSCYLEQGAILNFDLASVTNAVSNDLLIVSNAISSTGPITLNLNVLPMPAINQPYIIITAANIDPNFLASLVIPPSEYNASLGILNGTNVTVTFSASANSPLTWQGDGSLNEWQIGLSGQWINSAMAPAIFHNTDAVIFDDTSPNYAVNLVGTNLPGSVSVMANNNQYTLGGSGVIAGLTPVIKTGTATLIMASTNTYSGGTILSNNSGMIVASTVPVSTTLSTQTTLGSGPVAIGAGSALLLNDVLPTSAAVTYITNVFTGTGWLALNFASGTSARNTYLTNAVLFAGTIELTNPATTADKWNINVGNYASRLQIDNGNQLFDAAAGTVAFSAISVVGTGNTEARGAIRMSAATAVLAGPIALQGSTTIGMETAGATISGVMTNATASPITLTDGTANSTGAGIFSGVIGDGTAGGTLSLTKVNSGTLILATNNTFSGPTAITAGAIQLNQMGALSNSLTTVSVANGLTFGAGIPSFLLGGLAGTGGFALQATNATAIALVVGSNGSTGVYSGVLSGGGSLTKVGGGALTLSANNTYLGGTVVNGGVLAVGGTNYGAFTNNATLGTLAGFGGTPATLSLSNNLVLNPNTALLMGLGAATNVGAGINDFILVNGNLWINGAVTVGLSLTATPVIGKPYTLIQFTGTLGGTAGSLTLTNARYSVLVATNGNTITATFQPAAAGIEPLVWQGDGNYNQWILATAFDWVNGLGPAMFYGGDTVLFNDTSGNVNVTLVGNLVPNSVTVNAAEPYWFQGNGAIVGPTPLYKGGTGTLSLNTTNTYGGGTIISNNSGTIVAATVNGTQNTLGSGPVSIGAGSTLYLNDSSTASAAATYITNVITGSGWFTLNFAQGTSARNTYVTNANLFAGTIELSSVAGATADKWNVTQTNYASTLQIDAGAQLFDTSTGTVSFARIFVQGTGNSENRGAIRLSAATTVLAAPLALQADTAIGMEIPGATISGVISNATAGPVTLTDGTVSSSGAGTFAGVISDGTAGGTLALTKTATGTLVLATNNTFSGPTTVAAGGGSIQLNHPYALSNSIVTTAYSTVNGLSFSPGIGTFVLGGIAGEGLWAVADTTNGPVTVEVGYNNQNTNYDGGLTGVGSLVKVGTGTLTFSGSAGLAVGYAGSTTISNGAILVNTSAGFSSNTVTVAANGTLGGAGTIPGAVTVLAGGTLMPGAASGTIGTLTLTSNLVLSAGSYTVIEVDKGNVQNDLVTGLTGVSYGGTLMVSNLSGTLALGDSFPIFAALTATGNFNAITPAPGTGLAWAFNPATGMLSVVNASTVATNPTNLIYQVTGKTLTLTWPGDHLGWFIQSNSVSLLSPSQWYDIAGSDSATNLVITIDPAQKDVFFRMRKP